MNRTIHDQVLAQLAGMAYGARQPSVVVRISVDADSSRTVEHLLSERFGAPADAAEEPTCLASVLLHFGRAVQQAAKLPVFDPGRLLQTKTAPGRPTELFLQVPCPPNHPRAATDTIRWLCQWLGTSVAPSRAGLAESLADLLRRLRTLAPRGSEQLHLLRSAHRRGVPWDRLAGNLFQLGWGSRRRIIENTFSDRTPTTAMLLARSKSMTAEVLRRAGLPAPVHLRATDEDDAVAIAEHLGYPVVVKPADLDGGVGVSPGMGDAAAVRRAYARAAAHSKQVLVERHVDGHDFRIGVFNGRVLWASHRLPGAVTGNGIDTVQALVDQVNQDPRRGKDDTAALKALILDDEALELLASRGMTPHSVPRAGEFVALRRAASVSQGGTATELPASAFHPDNLDVCVMATRAVGLDFAGIDLILTDPLRSWREVGGLICEVNGAPQLSLTADPRWFDQVIDEWMPDQGRLPAVVVVGQPSLPIGTAIAQGLRQRGWCVGTASDQGARINGPPAGELHSAFAAARALLSDDLVEALVVELSGPSALDTGMPMDQFDALVVVSPTGQAQDPDATRLVRMLAPHSRTGVMTVDVPTSTSALDDLVARVLQIVESRREPAGAPEPRP